MFQFIHRPPGHGSAPELHRPSLHHPGRSHHLLRQAHAVLTGTGAVSDGDGESLRMGFRPMVRTFGKASNGAFTSYRSKRAIQSPRMWGDWLRRKPVSSATATDRPKSSAETCPLGSITRSFPPGFKALWMLLKNTA